MREAEASEARLQQELAQARSQAREAEAGQEAAGAAAAAAREAAAAARGELEHARLLAAQQEERLAATGCAEAADTARHGLGVIQSASRPQLVYGRSPLGSKR
jgi:hypothetical protein